MIDAEVAPALGPSRVRRHLSRWVAAAAAVVLVVSVGWWRVHPGRFAAVGDQAGVPAAEIGQPVLIGLFPGLDGDVVLRSVSPRVRVNTADAEVRVLLCDGARGTQPVGFEQTTAAQRCRRIVPVAGHHFTRVRSSASPQLVVLIVPRREGQVLVEGVDVSYSAGWQRGRQATGLEIAVTVPHRT